MPQPFRADLEQRTDRRQHKRRWIIRALVLTVLAIALSAGVYLWRTLFVDMPPLPNREALWSINRPAGYTFLDSKGQVIATRGPKHGRRTQVQTLPRHVTGAFLAMEDVRFYEHNGIDPKAISRAFTANLKAGHTVQGGSTLTQQLVKNLILTPERSLKRKIQEAWLALKIERMLSKDEILELYLNRIYLGEGTYGIEAAARTYFNKLPTDLSVAEAALLAALPKAPSRYDPTDNISDSRRRTRLVLKKMLESNVIGPQDYIAALRNPPKPVKNKGEGELGYILDMATAKAQELVGTDHPDLMIRLTLDQDIQAVAVQSLQTHLERKAKSAKAEQGGVVVLDKTGAVRALVGGKSYADSQFNRAAQAQRQPGSTFKVFVYAAALELGVHPDDFRQDTPITIAGWSPRNFDGQYVGPVSVREALAKSLNTVAVRLGQEVGPPKIISMARRFGIRSQLDPNLSLALGTSEVNLLELTGAFTVFQNDGRLRQPHFIQSIETAGREILYRHPDLEGRQVYDTMLSRRMVDMLTEVVSRGTAQRAKLKNQDVAGKTGTSQGYRDAWFVGFTPLYTTGVWVGNDDFTPMHKVVGGALPTEIWHGVMSKLHGERAASSFSKPDLTPQEEDAEKTLVFYRDLTLQLMSEAAALEAEMAPPAPPRANVAPQAPEPPPAPSAQR